MGILTGDNRLELFPGKEAVTSASIVLNNFVTTRGKRPLIGFNPGAAYGPAKRWPAEKFARLAEIVCRELDGIIVVFGTDADNKAAEVIRDGSCRAKSVLDLTGKTDLSTAMACIDLCDVFVTNDSGLMHVAAALATPTAAIFGSTDHIATGPWCDKFRIIRNSMDCSPCKKTHCPQGHLQCMEQISAEQVFKAVKELLEKLPPQDEGKTE